jgi:glucosamine kinase
VWAIAGADRAGLIAWAQGATARTLAPLAPLVFDNEAGDLAASQILDDAAAELAALADALDPSGALPLAVCGSVGQRLAPRLPVPLRQRCIEPAADAAQGALWMLQAQLNPLSPTHP